MSIVKSIAVGDGDMFYIRHNSDNFTMIDCCMDEDNQEQIVEELKEQSKGKGVTRFISTHPDDDHIRGLTYLHEHLNILNFYCVKNEATKDDSTEDFEQYCTLRDDAHKAFHIYAGCERRWMNKSNEERKQAGIEIFWPQTDNLYFKEALVTAKDGGVPNNISPIVKYELQSGAAIVWMGDLEKEFMEDLVDLGVIPVGPADIVFAPHHGRASGTIPSDWLAAMNPQLIVIGEAPSEHLNYYPGFNKITQNSAGDITFDCRQHEVHVFASEPDYEVDFLYDRNIQSSYGNYIGTLFV